MAVLEVESSVDLQERLIRRAWADDGFAELLRTNPHLAISEETGVELPRDIEIQVHEESDDTLHLVIPKKPIGAPDVPWEVKMGGTSTGPCGSMCATLGCQCMTAGCEPE
jgi:hypothetical protein